LDILEYLIHHSLKGAGRVSQSKEHDLWFEETIFGLKCHFLLISCFDPDVVISSSYVEFGEDMCILHLTDKVRDERKGILVPDGVLIQLLVILNQSEFAIFLFHKEEG